MVLAKFPRDICIFFYRLKSANSRNYLSKIKPEKQMINRNRSNIILCVAEKHDAAKNVAKFLSNGTMRLEKGRGKYIYNFTFNCM